MSTDCCTYGCTQGPHCPARATPATMLKTCDDLGVCQRAGHECAGACEREMQLHGIQYTQEQPTTYTWDQLLHQVCVVAVYGSSAAISCGVIGYLWARFA